MSYIAWLFKGKGGKSVIKRTYVRVGRTVYLKGQRINKAVSQDGSFVKEAWASLFDESTSIRPVVALDIQSYPA